MRTLPVPLLVAALAAAQLSCAAMGRGKSAGRGSDLVERALAAQGGADAVGKLRTLSIKGSATHWEPEQSVKASGEPRLAGESTFSASRDLDAHTTRIEWVRKLVYPAPREYRFTEIVTPVAGAVQGVDTTARTKQSQQSNPPQHAMSSLRVAAAHRELHRNSPRLILDLESNPARVTRLPDEQVGGHAFPALKYQATNDVAFVVLFDPGTGLPARVRTHDADNIHGDSTYDLVLEDWRDVAGAKVAHAHRYELNGKEIARIRYDEVQANPALDASTFAIPAELQATAAKPAAGKVPYQWVIRRQHIGTYLDSDAIYYDPAASGGLTLADLAPGVHQVVGGSHNSLVVELADGLAVVDAPVDDGQSRITLDALEAKYPGKPVRYLVLTHHHMDHAGGARAYAAKGATLVVGAGNGEHFRRALAAPSRSAGGAAAAPARTPQIVEVADRHVLGAGARTLEVHRIDNPHAEGMLLAYVPEAKLGFVTDLWSPGRDKLGEAPTPGQAAVIAAVQKAGITPERFAGGHGTVADYASLEALAKK